MARMVKMTRAARKVFAKKTRPTYMALREQFHLRGGGYL